MFVRMFVVFDHLACQAAFFYSDRLCAISDDHETEQAAICMFFGRRTESYRDKPIGRRFGLPIWLVARRLQNSLFRVL
jgi:hypothetical protein